MNDKYNTVVNSGEGFYSEKRSRFLAFALHVESEDEVKTIVAEYKKKYFDARHVCYAYILGYDSERTRANDDGEPSGSAGQPILRQLRSFEVTFTLVIVVRYYGGINLGTGGLVVAYKIAAAEALSDAAIEEKYVMRQCEISVPYPDVDKVMRYVKEFDAEIVRRDYTATTTDLIIMYKLSHERSLLSKLGIESPE